MKYKRSKDGGTIHRAGCGMLKNGGNPWPWADGLSEIALREKLRLYGVYKFCKVCFGGDEDRDETERLLLRRQLELEQSGG